MPIAPGAVVTSNCPGESQAADDGYRQLAEQVGSACDAARLGGGFRGEPQDPLLGRR